MTTEQFEQAKREFAYKHTTPDMSRIKEGFVPSEDNMNALLSDLNSLLEQHKEVILAAQQSKMPTEEDIVKQADARFTDRITGFVHSDKRDGFIRCGRWMLKLSGFATKQRRDE